MIGDRWVGVEPGLPEVPEPAAGQHIESGLLLRLISDQRIAFLLVGILNTAISLAAFWMLSRFIHIWGGDAAVLGAQLIAIPCAFILHRRFVFRVVGQVLRDLGRFALVNVIPVGVNLVVLPVLTEGFTVPVLVAQVGFTVVWVIASYFLHRGFSFRRTGADQTNSLEVPPTKRPER
ncbi:MAG: GtrA family protein [Actinomycetota bacterium]|nr:GtrA family protein [Actinomycetota bacterium]